MVLPALHFQKASSFIREPDIFNQSQLLQKALIGWKKASPQKSLLFLDMQIR